MIFFSLTKLNLTHTTQETKTLGNTTTLKIINPTVTDSDENKIDKIPDKEFKGVIIIIFKEHKEETNKLLGDSPK